MTLVELASLVEIVGALGVMASLVFVGVQIKKNTASNQANMLQNTINQDMDILLQLSTSEEMSVAWEEYIFQKENLTEEQRQRFKWLFGAKLRHWENVYL